MAEEECVEIILNYLGEDYIVKTTIEIANRLLNDPIAAENYMKKNLDANKKDDAYPVDSSIWTSKKPTPRDHESTLLFLALREKYNDKFNNRKTCKNTIWKAINDEMVANGYKIAGTSIKEVTEKLRQKFANLQRQYYDYFKRINTTGESAQKPPPYFDQMHNILKFKDKTSPQRLEDSLVEEAAQPVQKNIGLEGNNEENEDRNDENLQTDKENIRDAIKNRFKTKTNIKTSSNTTEIIKTITTLHEQDMLNRQKQFTAIENLLKVQIEQRDRFLDLFERSITNNDKSSRKRRCPDDDDLILF